MTSVSSAWVASRWPVPQPHHDKYSRGVLGVVAGSEAYPGAAVLVVSGAARAGVGLVRFVGPRRTQDLVLAARPEAIVYDPADVADRLPSASAWVIGSGVADHPGQEAVIGAVLASGRPVVADAGALESCVKARAAGARDTAPDRVLLTPHERELVRALAAIKHEVSLEEVARDRHAAARLLAETARATVLLKGSRTLVAVPGGAVIELPEAPPWLATGGSGDVLAGIAGALLSAGLTAADAGVAASWIHAQAGAMASRGGPIAALDIADALPAAIARALSRVEPSVQGL